MADKNLPDFNEIWPEWKPVEKVGEGSFGRVYKCERNEYGINATCAVKVISIPKNESEINAIRAECGSEESVKAHFKEIVDDFANEIKMMVILKGAPNIVSVENYKIVERTDSIGWDIYIRMEFLTTFSEFARKNSFTERAVVRLAIDLCNALEICAEKNIIHRDIKPDNIFIDSYGNYKIGDFGVARKLENTMSAMSKKGTYTYMAPEVYKGDSYDNRADIYSLGMVMYKLLNRGRDPFTDPYSETVSYHDRQVSLERRMKGENLNAPADASLQLSKIIIKACSYDPRNRYASPSDLKRELTLFVENASDSLNVPVTSTSNTGSNESSLSKKSVSLPLFMDEGLVHGKAKAEVSSVNSSNPVPPKPQPVAVKPAVNATNVQPAPAPQPVRPAPQPVRPAPQPAAPAPVQPQPQFQAVPSAMPAKKSSSKTGIIIAVVATLIVVVAAVVGVFLITNSSSSSEKTSNEAAKTENIQKTNIAQIDSLESKYVNNEITYSEASDEISGYLDSDNEEVKTRAEEALAAIEAIKPDRDIHDEAVNLYDMGSYALAIDKLNGISSDYPQYDETQVLISTVKQSYKSSAISNAQNYSANHDFESARNELEALQKYVDDTDVSDAYNAIYEAEFVYYRDNQEVYVVSGSEELFYDSSSGNCLRMNFTNSTGKQIIAVYLSALEFDSYGNPVTRTQHVGEYPNEHYLSSPNKVDAYSTYNMVNEKKHWDGMVSNTSYVIGCVRSVEYADGTTWYNPYYNLWLEKYHNSYYDYAN